MNRPAFVLLLASLALAACAGPGGSYAPLRGFGGAPTALGNAGGPAGGRAGGPAVAILLPLSGANAERGQALLHAAELALDVPGSPRLDPRDTTGTPAGAAAAANAAIAAGDGLILGPLTAAETAAVSGPARAAGIAVLAFTSDPRKAAPGVWTLGLTAAQQVRRLVSARQADGHDRFAALLPDNEFGHAMAGALAATAAQPTIRFHAGGMASMNQVARDLSDYADRRGPIDAKIRTARAQHDAEGRREAADLARQPIPPPPFDSLLLADTGEKLSEVASLLPYYDIAAPEVRILGPALWADPAARSGSSRALRGAWYAAPDPVARADFVNRYQAKYGAPAPGLADLAYDAASLARVLAGEGSYRSASLARSGGFAGVDGVFTLLPSGEVRRALAVFEVAPGGASLVQPAPATLGGPGT